MPQRYAYGYDAQEDLERAESELRAAEVQIEAYEEALRSIAAMPPAGAFFCRQIARDVLNKMEPSDG